MLMCFFFFSTSAIYSQQFPFLWGSYDIPKYIARAADAEFLNDDAHESQCGAKLDETVQVLVDLKASLIVRALATWGSSNRFEPYANPNGAWWYKQNVSCVVDKINNAYAAAGLRRPIIQAGIFEFVDPSVEEVTINTDVMEAFKNEIFLSGNSTRYLNGTTPRVDVKYKYNNVRRTDGVQYWRTCPDLTKLEGMMWLYQQAKFYIDEGAYALHLGQMGYIARFDDRDVAICRGKLERLVGFIRAYAQLKGHFVLLSAEAQGHEYVSPNGQQLFDFKSSALRPKGINGYEADLPNCFGEQNAKTVVTGSPNSPHLLNSGYGVSPSGWSYNNYPYSTYFDFGSGRVCPIRNEPNINVDGVDYVWGKDDVRWFNDLNNTCQADWLKKYMCQLRDVENGMGSLQAPVKMLVAEGKDCEIQINNNYYMADRSIVKNAIQELWAVKTPTIDIINRSCEDSYGPAFNEYDFSVGNSDCTSVYSWHIKNPNGSWQAFTYGKHRHFNPPSSGLYTIYLRQDNFGLPTETFGVQQIQSTVYLVRRKCPPSHSIAGGLGSESISVFPNPTQDEIVVNYNVVEPCSVSMKVYNMTGNNILTLKDNLDFQSPNNLSEKFDISKLTSGVYVLVVFNNGKVKGRVKFTKL
jgi:hypothetical protein